MKLEELLQAMVDANASDIFVIAGLPLTYQSGSQQIRSTDQALMPADTEVIVREIYNIAHRSIEPFLMSHNHDDDFSFRNF